MAELQAHDVGRAGEPIHVDINLRSAVLFDPGTGKALRGFPPMTTKTSSAGPSRAVKLCGARGDRSARAGGSPPDS